MKKRNLIPILLCIIMLLFAACSTKKNDFSSPKMVEKIMENMTLSDMVYQMMFVTPESITGVSPVTMAEETTKNSIETQPVGGIVYFSPNIVNREQTKQMIANSQGYSKIPLFIGVDEEGGRVSRVGSNSAMGIIKHPPMIEIGNSGDSEKAYHVGASLGEQLSELGFNVNFAPVADVIVNAKNTEIGDRSFGTEPQLVADMVRSVVKGLQQNGVSSALKHFPGHGSTYADSHKGYSQSDRTLEQIRQTEFVPFKAGIDEGAHFVMVSHMTLVNATNEKLPSSVSKEVITDMLINELGFGGIVITDSFSMGAIKGEMSLGEAAIKAISAGADMILMPYDVKLCHDCIIEAVNNGTITQQRIQSSVEKILKLKVQKGMIK